MLFGVPGMVGTYAGAWVAGFVPGFVQLFVFAGVMVLAAVQMWRRASGSKKSPAGDSTVPRSKWKISGDGLAVGALTGFVGVGGGFLIVPALVLLGGLDMRRAVGTSLVIIALKSAAGFWKYFDVLGDGGADFAWGVIGVFVACGAVGSFVGSSLGGRLNQRALQRGFAVFLGAMAVFIGVREGVDLVGDTSPNAEAAGEAAPASDG